MPEEAILLEKMAHTPRDQPPETSDDQFAGPNVNLIRGLSKAAWRLYVFYGPFAPVVVVGILLVLRQARPDRDLRRLVLAWGLVYLLLNLVSGGLPGPNLLRYNKDMEIIAPLCCLALAAIWGVLATRSVLLATAGSASYVVFVVWRAVAYFSQTAIVDRSSGLR